LGEIFAVLKFFPTLPQKWDLRFS